MAANAASSANDLDNGHIVGRVKPLLAANAIDKHYVQGVPVLQNIDFSVDAGEVVALVGENGAGKSTLVKVLSGVVVPNAGTLFVNGAERLFHDVHAAEAQGIVLVPQELRVAPLLTVAENMYIGHLPRNRFGMVDFVRLERETREWLKVFEIDVDPLSPMGRYSTSEQKMFMIAGALSKNATVLLLDEPTAALTDAEAQHLFAHVLRLRKRGIGIVLITHRLDDVEQIADRVVVMRNGQIVDRLESAVGRRGQIVRSMIGRDLESMPKRGKLAASTGTTLLDVKDMRVEDPDVAGKMRVDGLDLTIKAGEIHGLYGLIGAGRTEFARALFGDWRGNVTGDVNILGHSRVPRSPGEAIGLGIAMLTEDRKATGLLDGHTLHTNFSASSLRSVSNFGVIDRRREYERNQQMLSELDVRPPSLSAIIDSLSGGNQQKVLLGRWLNAKPKILILDEPTLGVDVGARFQIYQKIAELALSGLGVLLISSDTDEVLMECDRITVMYKGKKIKELQGHSTREQLVAAATGGLQ